MNKLIFDIETGPRADASDWLDEVTAPSNYKDADKIKAYIFEQNGKALDRAALSAVTGEVLAIGTYDGTFKQIYCFESERDTLLEFVEALNVTRMQDDFALVGFNSEGFDIPFLVRRCMVHGIKFPVRFWRRPQAYEHSIDLMKIWQMGNKEDRISLNKVCKLLGLGEKTGDGRFFYQTLKEDRAKALAYLEQDLGLHHLLAERMGVLE